MTMEHILEYKHFKVWPSKDNVKDPNEPFFNDDKYDYKRRKEIFGTKDISKNSNYKSEERIEIDPDVVDDLLATEDLSDSVIKILNKIKEYAIGYHEYQEMADADYPASYLVFEDVSDDDVITLKRLGFGVRIYDDSNEYSESFGDKCRVIWIWK